MGAAEGSVLTEPPWCNLPQQNDQRHKFLVPFALHRMHERDNDPERAAAPQLVVNYCDGSQTISVPPNVPVTDVAPQIRSLLAQAMLSVRDDREKLPDGTLL